MIHLHLHSDYSVLDSLLRVKDIVRYAKENNQSAITLTDHGTLGGLVEFYQECKKQGIKPILGCEFYHGQDKKNYHIVALAKNRQGFDNLIRLNNISVERFYKNPRIFDEDIFKYHDGIIWMSACISGYLAKTYLEGEFDLSWYRKMKDLDFYLEYQDAGMVEQKKVKEKFLSMQVPVVRTVDAHYMKPEDKKTHDILYAVKSHKPVGEYSLTGNYALNQDFEDETSEEIADKIEEYEIIGENWKMPEIELNRESLFRDLVSKCPDEKEYLKRLDYEFGVIWDNDFFPYFSMVADLCAHFDKKDRFRGWGRGSASGSLISYLMGITKIDPLKWHLHFERFLNPDRVSPPDIDLDFLPEDKDEAIQYMQKYGNYRKIGSYCTFGAKEAINTVSKFLHIDTVLAKYVPNEVPIPSLSDLMKTEIFTGIVRREVAEEFIQTCIKIEGIKRNYTVHASGIVNVEGVPLRKSKGVVTTDWNMYSLEDMKYIKVDILGVTTLATIDRVVKKLGIKVEDIPLDDKQTYDLIKEGWTIGMFQWESLGFGNVIKQFKPVEFDELIDVQALYRPGCQESGITAEYIARKHGKPIVQWHEKLHFKRQGLPLFQEEIMEAVRVLAGFTMAEADTIRKAIGRKVKKDIQVMRDGFVSGCAKHSQIKADKANEIWDQIEKFSRYTWNLSHSTAYAFISYWTAYLSARYPVEFFCELLNGADNTLRKIILLNECRRRGLGLEYPNLNHSGKGYEAIEGKIYIGLLGIKYLGEKTVDKIIEAKPFEDKDDFKKKTKVNKKVMEVLGKIGFFGGVPTLEDELEYLGCYLRDRKIDRIWWGKYANIGEIFDVRKKVTRRGNPMAFISVQFLDDVKSIVIFHEIWNKRELECGQIGIFTVDDRDILRRFNDDLSTFRVALKINMKVGKMGLNSNVFYKHAPMGYIKMDDKALRMLEKIGIQYIY